MSSQTALLVTLLLLSSGESRQETVPQDLDRLQGEWTMTSGRVDGVDTVVDPEHPMRCKVQGTKVSFVHNGKVVEEVTIRLDPALRTSHPGPSQPPLPAAVSPHPWSAIDATLANNAIAPGIYRLEAETFTLCYTAPGKPRPTDFNAKAGSGHKLSVWKRRMKSKA